MTIAGIVGGVLAYVAAGIPIGLLIGRAKGIPDIRKHGSGNIGATNVMRVIGIKAALLVWGIDVLKGTAPVLFSRHVLGLEDWWLGVTAVLAVAGHCYSPYLRFDGGKGVATGLGAILGLYWPAGLCAFSVFLVLVPLTRYISLGSVLGSSSGPFWVLLWMLPDASISSHATSYAVMTGIAIAIINIRHAANIKRLLAGTERKFGQKDPTEPEPEAEDDDQLADD